MIFFPQAHLVYLVFPLCTLQHIVHGFVHATLGKHGNCLSCKLYLPKVADKAYSMAIDRYIGATQLFNHSTRLTSFTDYPALNTLKGVWRLAGVVMQIDLLEY